ncbi:transposable element Tcb1 transposase [Trichonephila clavipes]|nr:transposable element Tcb1 transposase [Trichonephila clavipes]
MRKLEEKDANLDGEEIKAHEIHSRSFEHHAGDYYLARFRSNFVGEHPGVDRDPLSLLPFHQPHERTGEFYSPGYSPNSPRVALSATLIETHAMLWQRFQDDGNVSRCYSTGHPHVNTPNEDRYIYLAVTAKRNRRSTASDLSRQLSSATDTTVSRQTMYRRLGNIGLYARRPVRCVPHTATHCRLRLTWSREHALGTPQQWSCVMFYDESRFSLQSDSPWTLIWRAPGTRYHQENTIERHPYGGAG